MFEYIYHYENAIIYNLPLICVIWIYHFVINHFPLSQQQQQNMYEIFSIDKDISYYVICLKLLFSWASSYISLFIACRWYNVFDDYSQMLDICVYKNGKHPMAIFALTSSLTLSNFSHSWMSVIKDGCDVVFCDFPHHRILSTGNFIGRGTKEWNVSLKCSIRHNSLISLEVCVCSCVCVLRTIENNFRMYLNQFNCNSSITYFHNQ